MKEIIHKLNIKEEFKNNKIYFIAKIILSLIFATTIMLDTMLNFNGSIFGPLSEIYFSEIKITNILIFILTFIISYIILTILEYVSDLLENTFYTKKERKNKNIKVFFIIWLVILVCWLPYILSYYPGGVYADTVRSIQQGMGREAISNNNPILYALILKLFLNIGIMIKSEYLGIQLFSIAQVLVMSGAISYFIYLLYKKKISMKYIVLITAFFGIFKLIPVYAISIWKDTPFCIALFLYIVLIMEIIYNNAKNLEKPGGIIHYVILSILVAFLRNNGIYVIFLTTLVLLIVYRKSVLNKLRALSISSILTIILCLIVQGPVYRHYNLTTSFVESLGVPIQQMCYVVADNGDITEEQLEFINNMCPIEVIKEKYNPCIVDKIKWDESFNNEFLEENKAEFFKTWFQIFLKNPSSYVKAYLLNTIGFWDVNKSTNDGYANMTMWWNVESELQYKQEDVIKNITDVSIRKVLEIKTTISSAVFLFIMLTGIVITIYKKRYKNLIIFMPMFLTWLTVMIAAPLASSLRYVYILVLTVPISLLIPFLKSRDEINQK